MLTHPSIGIWIQSNKYKILKRIFVNLEFKIYLLYKLACWNSGHDNKEYNLIVYKFDVIPHSD